MKSQSPTHVTRPDAIKLSALIEHLSVTRGEQADLLQEVLDLADIVPSSSITPEVVTLKSRVEIEDALTGQAREITLVLPDQFDPAAGRISVVSPMGRALLGRRVGDVVEVQVPAGDTRAIRLKAIPYQPEAHGIHDSE
jgi:regulator of nucleoside diphosphate kinase